MIALICFVLAVLVSAFKSKSRLEAENAVLRHQLIVLQRKVRGRAHLTNNDRGFFVPMYRWFPSILKVVRIIQPETLVRWHRAGFRRYEFSVHTGRQCDALSGWRASRTRQVPAVDFSFLALTADDATAHFLSHRFAQADHHCRSSDG